MNNDEHSWRIVTLSKGEQRLKWKNWQIYLYTFYAENLLPQVVKICFIGWLFISSYLLSWNEKMYYTEEINWDTEPIVTLAMFIVFYSIFGHVVYFVVHPTILFVNCVFVLLFCVFGRPSHPGICNKKRPAVRWQPWLALCSSSLTYDNDEEKETYDNDDHDLYIIGALGPCRPKAGQGLVMIMMIILRWLKSSYIDFVIMVTLQMMKMVMVMTKMQCCNMSINLHSWALGNQQ